MKQLDRNKLQMFDFMMRVIFILISFIIAEVFIASGASNVWNKICIYLIAILIGVVLNGILMLVIKKTPSLRKYFEIQGE